MFGLDVCRTIAILSVVVGHMLQHSSPHPLLASFGVVGLFGVDLFFCLSGFLIGRILLQESLRWPEEKESGLLRFWYRRWMRTLPLYFFFFFISIKYDWKGATTVYSQLSYLVFAQNLAWPMTDFFRLSWSLAVEEWFYYSFPLILLFLIGCGKKPRSAAVVTIVCFLLIPPFMRLTLPGHPYNFQNIDQEIRQVVSFRLDSIGFGVLIAFIYQWNKALFLQLSKLWWLFLSLVIFCVICTKWGYFGLSENKLFVALYFSFSAFAFAGLIPFFTVLTSSRFKLLNRFVKFTSLNSYSMYLGHIFAFMISINIFHRFGVFDSVYSNPWLAYPIFLIFVYLLSSLTYFAIEKPVLAIRNRQSKDRSVVPSQPLTTV
jgi:peptidoglycan/LPS O-acetylase OafA/YrhL